ncbi:MAG TPA: hypothetical protein VKW06_04630 [Candidatus Angelobacter sp.]|nr:hypothetical protein [Candidatus Angelobacter sp.]
MLRLASFSIALALILPAQGQIPSTGIPASVVSPTADGRQHGIPASVVSPKPPIQGVFRANRRAVSGSRRLRHFGNPHRRALLVPVPLFYPAFGATYDAEAAVTDPADPGAVDRSDTAQGDDEDSVPVRDEEALRRAYLQGARDALGRQADRYGKHYTDSRENDRSKTLAQNKPPQMAATPAVDDSPSAVFIFKDGHQIETRNFAIMGQTLYDFSSSGLKKVELSDIDATATQRANDDRGISVKLN